MAGGHYLVAEYSPIIATRVWKEKLNINPLRVCLVIGPISL